MEESTSNQEKNNNPLTINGLLTELYGKEAFTITVYHALLNALDKRINEATKTGILIATNKLKPILEELVNNAKKID